MADLSGKSIGRYHIIAPLGEGGMAQVYKAYDTRLEREVAIKVIRTGDIPPNHLDKLLKRFEREAKRMAKFTHPNIVSIIDYGEHEGTPYLVMPYLSGGTLRDMLKARKRKPMSHQEAARLLLPIAYALEYAHKQETIHRDVKPANILLTDEGQPMLTDFGVAKILDLDEGQTLTNTGVGVGTPKYMAPEQWKNKVVPQTDVYALGVVLYQMVTGSVPYDADTPAGVHEKQLTEPLPRPQDLNPTLPDEVERVLYKALAKDALERYDMGQFAQALEKLMQEQRAGSEQIMAEMDTKKREEQTASLSQQYVKMEQTRPQGEQKRRIFIDVLLFIILPTLLGIWVLTNGQSSLNRASVFQLGTLTTAKTPTSIQGITNESQDIYDTFDNPEYEGKYNPALWTFTGDDPVYIISQKNGMFTLSGKTAQKSAKMVLKKYANIIIDKPMFFQADVIFPSTSAYGAVNIGLETKGWYTECQLAKDPSVEGNPIKGCVQSRWPRDEKYVYNTAYPAAEYDKKSTLRIEVEPNTMSIKYIIDGVVLGNDVPQDANILKNSYFTFKIETWNNNGFGEVSGYFDNVMVGVLPDLSKQDEQKLPTSNKLQPTEIQKIEDITGSDLYDSFDELVYENNYNPDLWEWWSNNSQNTLIQKEGVLIGSSFTKGTAVHLNARKYMNIAIGKPVYFQSDIILKSKSTTGNVKIQYFTNNTEDWFMECGIGFHEGMKQPGKGCWGGRAASPEEAPEYNIIFNGNFDKWYTFRIEVFPEKMEFVFYMDGKKIGSHIPKDAEVLKKAHFNVSVGVSAEADGKISGEFDNVRIGEIQ